MINNRIFIELGFSIILVIAYFVYFIAKYKKSPGFLAGIMWGLGAFFVSNAFTNIVNIAGSYLINEGILTLNVPVSIFFAGLSRAVGVVFSGYFIFRMMKKNGKFDEENTASPVGFMSGSGILASPFNANAHLLALVQLVTNAIIINRNPTQEELGSITLEQLQEIKEIYETAPMFEFLSFAIYGLVLAFGFVIIYRLVAAYDKREKPFARLALPFLVAFVFYILVEGLPALDVLPIIKIVVLLAVTFGTYVFVEKKLIPNA